MLPYLEDLEIIKKKLREDLDFSSYSFFDNRLDLLIQCIEALEYYADEDLYVPVKIDTGKGGVGTIIATRESIPGRRAQGMLHYVCDELLDECD